MVTMPAVIRLSGPFGYALAVLAGVILVQSARAALTAARGDREAGPVLRNQTNAILFWGVASAVLGFLGQCHGTYLALSAIFSAPEISPQIVAEGFVISFIPTLFGLGILVFATVVWVCLRILPRENARGFRVALVILILLGCDPGTHRGPGDLTDGVWTLQAGEDLFLWEFTSDSVADFDCMVQDLRGGLKIMETPCSSADLDGVSLGLAMPNGVRYEGQVDLDRGWIEGSLLYVDGSSLEAPLKWAPHEDYPSLRPRAPGLGPYAFRPPEDRGDGWRVAPASERGVDPEALGRTVEAILKGEAGFLKSFLVLRGDALLLEEYFHGYGPDDLSPIMSCTKSVSSLLIGLAIQEGRIPGVDTPLLEFFPQDRQDVGSGWEDLTLEHLLTMSMALDWSPDEAENLHGTGPAAFRQILSRNVVGGPGLEWQYVNMNVNLLAGVLHQATGEHAEAFASRALFGPLGITEWSWGDGRAGGFNLMDGSLWLRPRDMARIGVMMLAGGVWQGHRVLDEQWVQSSMTPHLPAGSGGEGYGYLWWTMEVPGPEGRSLQVVFANGWGSQFILLIPELELVVVTTGGNQENGKHFAIGEVLVRDLLPGLEGIPS
jgi:CubicO group peptidase (beta-lactamase class C family)